MADNSAIEWTDATWNPVTGCSKVSPGCANCYAETLSLRYGYSKKPWTPANATENVVLHPERLELPLRWQRPRMVFVNSMSDLFHELVPVAFIARVFNVMASAIAECGKRHQHDDDCWGDRRHIFQVLTKRPERMRAVLADELPSHVADEWPGDCPISVAMELGDWPLPNVWLGTSIENNRFTGRADELRATRAAVRFISAEPLLGPLPSLDLAAIDWLIVGGESAGPPNRRLVEPAAQSTFHLRSSGRFERGQRWEPKPEALGWVRDLRDRALRTGTAFFFKQWGGPRPKSGGRDLDGRTWDELPRRRLATDAGTDASDQSARQRSPSPRSPALARAG